MRSASRINSSLNKRRRLTLLKKIGYATIFVLFFISLLVLSLTNEKIQIKSVSIKGNYSVSKEDIESIVNNNLDKRYLFIVRSDNFFLLRRWGIENEILDNFKKIKSVDLWFDNLNDLEVNITERVAKSLWCDSKCYFMDEEGFIFAEAPNFNTNPFPEYRGLISGDPIGKSYFNPLIFKDISSFFLSLKEMNLKPEYFKAINEHEYEVILTTGGKIILDDKKPFTKDIVNLQAVIDSGYIKTDTVSLKKIDYIDLRYGNKVIFK